MNTLAEMRKRSGKTQMDVAAALRVDRSAVAKWETGAALPRTVLLPKLANLYGCTVDELLNEDGEGKGDESA